MGKAKSIGIGIAGVIGAIVLMFIVGQAILIGSEYSGASTARISADYYEGENTVEVILQLLNDDADYVRANGQFELKIYGGTIFTDPNNLVYSKS